jgi:hypothetical protein
MILLVLARCAPTTALTDERLAGMGDHVRRASPRFYVRIQTGDEGRESCADDLLCRIVEARNVVNRNSRTLV